MQKFRESHWKKTGIKSEKKSSRKDPAKKTQKILKNKEEIAIEGSKKKIWDKCSNSFLQKPRKELCEKSGKGTSNGIPKELFEKFRIEVW